MGRTTRVTVVTCCLALCAAMVLGTGGAPVAAQVLPQTPSLPQGAAILTIISGEVAMRTATSSFAPAADGAVIYVGSTIRTGVDARAVITLFEGSTVELEPASDITVREATAQGGSTMIQLAQSLGRSWHVVTHLTTADSRYEVRTPAATASVRGTAFAVAIVDAASGTNTTVTTTDGLVAVADAAATGEVLVAPDQMTTVRTQAAPEPVRSAPAARRVVTVTAVSESSIVVDPLGRANGFRDGRVLAQTPGARVRMENGTIVVTLPNVPEGVFATSIAPTAGAASSVSMTVTDRGQEPVSITTPADAETGSAGVEVRATGGKPELRALDSDETKKLSDAKAGTKKPSGRPTAKPGPRVIATARPEVRPDAAPLRTADETPRVTATQRRLPTASPSPARR